MIRWLAPAIWLGAMAVGCAAPPAAKAPPSSVVAVASLPPLDLVPVVPAAELILSAVPRYMPFSWVQSAADGQVVTLATTNNSLNAHAPTTPRGFTVCLSENAISYEFYGLGDNAEPRVRANVQLDGRLARCDVATGQFYYLTIDSAVGIGFPTRDAVRYNVVSRDGFVPMSVCSTPVSCEALSVALPALEGALGGLKLGPPGMFKAP